MGNGPSLRFRDLDQLSDRSDVVTIASNRIDFAFSETDWRPDYFSVADPLVWSKYESIVRDLYPKILTPVSIDRSVDSSGKRIAYRHIDVVPTHQTEREREWYFSNDVSQGVFCGGTVTFENIQLAVHLGLNPIYLIGCDHSYQGSNEGSMNDTSVPIRQEAGVENHFAKGYRKEGEVVFSANMVQMNAAFEEARRYADAHGVKIFNLTRGGELEYFERLDFDSVFES